MSTTHIMYAWPHPFFGPIPVKSHRWYYRHSAVLWGHDRTMPYCTTNRPLLHTWAHTHSDWLVSLWLTGERVTPGLPQVILLSWYSNSRWRISFLPSLLFLCSNFPEKLRVSVFPIRESVWCSSSTTRKTEGEKQFYFVPFSWRILSPPGSRCSVMLTICAFESN